MGFASGFKVRVVPIAARFGSGFRSDGRMGGPWTLRFDTQDLVGPPVAARRRVRVQAQVWCWG